MEEMGAYMQLVQRVAGRVAWKLPWHVDRGDLIGAGSEGLLDAARRYDPAAGVAFGTYAEIRIRGAMLDELRDRDLLPRSERKRQAADPAATERTRFVSLDEPDAIELTDEAIDCEAKLARRQQVALMTEAVRRLPLRLQTVLSLYYVEELTLREVGQVMAITESRVCQLHREALVELRRALI